MPRSHGKAFIQGDQDGIIKLKKRTFEGGGLRLAWLKKERVFTSSLGLGAFYFDETHQDLITGADIVDNGVCINSYATFTWKVNKQVTLHDTIYYQPRYGRINDYRLLNHFTMSIKMSTSMSFNVGLDVIHDSDYPAVLFADPIDIRYTTSMSYLFL
ncbi:MAG: DUF481 domain-containing protein [Kiritimatiellae bacterium]|nr:DUF481 domain-containing protein [Kiritimatiellia bacterium]